MKTKVLIVDDVAEHRKWIKASLVDSITTSDIEEKVSLANRLFDIQSFSIVGEAIKAIDSGFHPNLSIVDLDFQNLKDSTIKKKSLQPTIEKTATRGFDLLKTIKKKCPNSVNVIFTGQAGNQIDIFHELNKNNLHFGKDWFLKSDKGYGATLLSNHMPYLLKKASRNIIQPLPANKRKSLIGFLSGMSTESDILKYRLQINDTYYTISSLLLGWVTHTKNSTNSVGMEYYNLNESIKELLVHDQKYAIKLNGIWKEEYMLSAVHEYQISDTYYDDKDRIDNLSADTILEICKQSHTLSNLDKYYSSIDFEGEGYNCSNEQNKSLENSTFRQKFFNALICRRVLLGLSKIQSQKRTTFRKNNIIDIVCSIVGRNPLSKGTTTQFINHLLGLSAKIGSAVQTIRVDPSLIFEEEYNWLQQFIPIIEKKINNREW